MDVPKHRIWLINPEEIIGHDVSEEILTRHFCRYLLYLKRGDIFVTTLELPRDYLAYVCALRGLPADLPWLVPVERTQEPYDLCALTGSQRLEFFRDLARTGRYMVEPFIQTPEVHALAREAGLRVSGTPAALVARGVVHDLNDKAYFKTLSARLGVETIDSVIAQSLDELVAAVKRTCRNGCSRAILKKSYSAGGHGNLAGGRDALLEAAGAWYAGGSVLVEEVLPLEETLGTVVNVTDDGCEYVGADRQLIADFGWQGCTFPFDGAALAGEVRELSMRYARHIFDAGARGMLNLDWGIERGGEKIYALEANFRHNGFSYMVDIASQALERSSEELRIAYYNSYPVTRTFPELLEATEPLKAGAGKSGGVILTTPVVNGTTGVIVAATSADALAEMERRMREALDG